MMLDASRLGDWAALPFFRDTLPGIEARLAAETRAVLPSPQQVFAALELTQPQDTRVIILGQDPYPTPGHAHGLAFSVAPDVTPLPRSLGNIFKELRSDVGAAPATGDLRGWARQGVLLLNTALTVPAGVANGHKDWGWAALVSQVLTLLSSAPRAFVLWGRQAQALGKELDDAHLRIESAHPSPLSAAKGFFDSRPFSRINSWLETQGSPAIDWALREGS